MKTPIADFVRGYEKQNMSRFHMPGHKGISFLGCEGYDITEIEGADSLYEASGIINESEKNATELFGTQRTIYSTEGSSQCIRAMLYLAMTYKKCKGRATVVASRNAHKSFLYAIAMLDLDVIWIWPKDQNSICSCHVTPETLGKTLREMDETPIAVYITSPDYLGKQSDIKELADICHKYNTILAVDNAHGAYLRFLTPSQHPIDCDADICCDSAHKTLPVLTGGAYLHIGKNAPDCFAKNAKKAMSLFGSTSPSYLILASLDLCNAYLFEGYREKLLRTIHRIKILRNQLRTVGWQVEETEALKVTVCAPYGTTGYDIADNLRKHQVECEYADFEYIICMITPENVDEDYARILEAFGENKNPYREYNKWENSSCTQVMSIRDAIFADSECIPVSESLNRICASPMVSCPPAIPIVVSGERINRNAIEMFQYYKIDTVEVVIE